MSMNKRLRSLSFSGLCLMLLAACSGDAEFSDLDTFMAKAKTKAASGSTIDPIPAFRRYKVFRYSATAFRAPFEVPVEVADLLAMPQGPRSDVKPDASRSKEFLEQFNIEALMMVGSVRMKGKLWVLIDDSSGGVHRVSLGNFIGRNHGKILSVSETQLQVVEIVSSGNDSWIERPRTIALREADGNGDG